MIGIAGRAGGRCSYVLTKRGSFLCLLNNNSGYDILELSFIPGGYNDAGITHIA